jgi:hypothetical protein
MSFRYNLSPVQIDELERVRTETRRLYGLTDTWLANAVLKLVRQAQKAAPALQPEDNTYPARYVYGLVPELVRRLGGVRLDPKEVDWEIRELSDYELRQCTGNCILHLEQWNLPGWDMLTREVANGNPVTFAMDRLRPGTLGDRQDPVTRRIEEIAGYRKKPYNGVWTLELLD